LILAQYVGTPSPIQRAGIEVQENLHLPGVEGVTRNRPAQEFAHQPVEPVEHYFQFYEIV
jgi:hypothetical protein